MKIQTVITQLEIEIQRNLAEAERIAETAKREGRAYLSEEESKRAEKLLSDVTVAKGKLAEARQIEAEEYEYESRKHERYPVDLPASRGAETHMSVNEREPAGRAASNRTGESTNWVYRDSGQPAALGRGQAFGDHPLVREYMNQTDSRDRHIIGTYGDLGQMVRSLSTSGASAMVPQLWANQVIDLARNKSAVLQAGPQIVPMNALTVNVARLSGDPTAAFRNQGDTITASDPSFDSVVLTARTISALVTGSLEFFQDSINGEQVVSNALGQALGLEFDKNALFGGLVTGANDEGFNLASPPSPKGLVKNLLDNASANVLGYVAAGTSITAATPFNEILDTIYQPRLYNFEPNTLIMNAKMAKKLAKSYDSTYQPLNQPKDMANLSQYVSNQIPSYTRGAMTNIATDVVVGKFDEMLVGHRIGLEIRVLNEKYAETGTVGIIAVMRVDVQLAHPYAFSVYRALGGA